MTITLLSLLRLSMRDVYHSTSELSVPFLSFLLRSSLYSALSCVWFYTVNVISYGLLYCVLPTILGTQLVIATAK